MSSKRKQTATEGPPSKKQQVESKLPQSLQQNLSILSEEQQGAARQLVEIGQAHIFDNWDAPGSASDAHKKSLMDHAIALETQYTGGLSAYVTRSIDLLGASEKGVNPYAGFVPSVPTGVVIDTETKEKKDELDRLETLGLTEAGQGAFVLVAGGLGERLGYPGIKVALPTEISTGMCYLEFYCQNILALQSRARGLAGDDSLVLPLAIMTSDDTDAPTRALIAEHKSFGMAEGQIVIMKQGKVPAINAGAKFVTSEDGSEFITKPHGHGDVHSLVYSTGLSAKWAKEGRKWVVFFQDTNGMVFHAIPAALGVSAENKFQVNSMTVARRPGEAVGAICKLSNADSGRVMTLNVEYNQLDDMMKAAGVEDTLNAQGYSNYPGNINVLVFDAQSYAEELEKSKGHISEFVNPKYGDATKSWFKKPTRLESMMQDYPKQLGPDARVGFTQCPRWMSFSAVKNNVDDAVKKQQSTGYAESACTGESDMYYVNRKLMKQAGVDIDVEGTKQTYQGIETAMGARVVITPWVAQTQADFCDVFQPSSPGSIKISPTSTLIVQGNCGGTVRVRSLDLDGTLIVNVQSGGTVEIDGLVVKNAGWEFETLTEGAEVPASLSIRGYTLVKKEQQEL